MIPRTRESRIAIETRQRAPPLSSLDVMQQRKQITFIGNRRRSITTLAVAAGVGALGVCALLFDHLIVGIVLVIVSAVPVAVSLPIAVSPRSRYLHLDPSGFDVHVRRHRYRIEWADVAGFRWGLHHGAAIIEIEYVADYAERNCLSAPGDKPVTARIFNRYNAPLPYVMGKLIEWRLRFGPRG
jgi:hypothetical protein